LLFNVVHFPQPIPPWFSRLPCHIFISIFILWPHFHFSVSLSTVVCLVTFVALDNIANNFLFYVDYFLDTLHRHLRFTWRGPHLPLQPFLLTSFSFVPLPSRAHHILMWKGFGGIVFWLFQQSSSPAPRAVLCFKLFSRDLQFVILRQAKSRDGGFRPQDSKRGFHPRSRCELRHFPNAIAALAFNYPA